MPKPTTKNMNDEEWTNEMHARLGKMFDTDDKKLGMILTMLGQSAVMTQFLADTFAPEKLPYPVVYGMAMTAGNMMALTSGESDVHIMDLSEPVFPELGEQAEEHIYRKMVKIVKLLHESVVEREKERQS